MEAEATSQIKGKEKNIDIILKRIEYLNTNAFEIDIFERIETFYDDNFEYHFQTLNVETALKSLFLNEDQSVLKKIQTLLEECKLKYSSYIRKLDKDAFCDFFNVEKDDFEKVIKWNNDQFCSLLDLVNSFLKDSESIESKFNILKLNLTNFGFYELPKIKNLTDDKQTKLVELINSNKIPYVIAMFDYLGFLKHLDKEYFKIKKQRDIEIGKWFDKNHRDISGEINILYIVPNEIKVRYKANLEKENVIKDYHQLK